MEIITLGIGAIWRQDRLTTNHEAFVAWGYDPKGEGDDILFYAEFGEGNIIPRLSKERFLQLPPQKFSGQVALDVE